MNLEWESRICLQHLVLKSVFDLYSSWGAYWFHRYREPFKLFSYFVYRKDSSTTNDSEQRVKNLYCMLLQLFSLFSLAISCSLPVTYVQVSLILNFFRLSDSDSSDAAFHISRAIHVSSSISFISCEMQSNCLSQPYTKKLKPVFKGPPSTFVNMVQYTTSSLANPDRSSDIPSLSTCHQFCMKDPYCVSFSLAKQFLFSNYKGLNASQLNF